MKEFEASQLFDYYLDLKDVFENYGYAVNRSGFCCCPFHRERTPSCSVNRLQFYCFGCHRKGNIVSFVEQLFELDFKTAVHKINDDFNLRILETSRLTPEQESAIKKRKLDVYKQTEEENKLQSIKEKYFLAWKHYVLYRPPRIYLNIDSEEYEVDNFFKEVDKRWWDAIATIDQLEDYAYIHNFKIYEFMAEQMFIKGEI